MRSLVLAVDDSDYGVRLVAEPDNDRLGKRLKSDFKAVAPAVKGGDCGSNKIDRL